MKSTNRSGSRRYFFRDLLSETIGTMEEIRGIRQCDLGEITKLPDSSIGKMIPIAAGRGAYRLSEDTLIKSSGEGRPDVLVRRFHEVENQALHLFDGRHSLEQIAEELAYHYLLNPKDAFRLVKSLFSEMTGYGVFLPGSPPDTDGGSAITASA